MEHTGISPADEVRQIVGQALHAAQHEATAGNVDGAVELYRAVLELQPGHAGAHHALGILAREQGQLADAIPLFAAALQNDAGEPAYWLAYIDALLAARQFATARELIDLGRRQGLAGPALDAYEQHLVASGAPDAAAIEAAAILFGQGLLDQAGQAAVVLTEQFPQHGFGWKLLGGVLHRQSALTPALYAMRQATVYAPDDGEAFSNLGLVLKDLNQLDEAEAALHRAIALQPDDAHAHNHMALVLLEAGRLADALASASRAVALDPAHPKAGNTLAIALQQLNRPLEAIAAFERYLARDPNQTDAHSNMLFCMSQMSTVSAAALFAEHVRFGEQVASRVGSPRADWTNTPDPQRQLRIGFVSGDLRNHAVARFVEPLFERLARRVQLALYVYYTHPVSDHYTALLRGQVAHWRDVAPLGDAALDALIRADGIDILVDLSGHTAYNRLPLFARKPAPLQLSWIGYPGTTGLKAMDYYLADRLLLPPGLLDRYFTEQLVQLPLLVPFQPAPDSPDLVPLPALTNGHLTFGSFNRLSKFSRAVIATWGRLLRALPDAQLVVAGMPEHGGHEQIMAWLAEEGVDPARVRTHGRVGMRTYLALHNEVDLCLDTFPYSGGTTSLHALWMGVPTLTLVGDTIAGRQTACILGHNGLDAFIAHDADDFVARGLAVCGDLPALARLRATLRERMPPPASDAMGQVADGVEDALRMMWERWCAGLPAASFEVPLRAYGATPDNADG